MMKKCKKALLFLVASLMVIGFHPTHAAAEEAQNVVRYCVDFSVFDWEKKDLPDAVYYQLCDDVIYNDDVEADETLFLPVDQNNEPQRKADKTSDTTFVFAFSEKELQAGKKLRIQWAADTYLHDEDGQSYYEYEAYTSYDEWLSKKTEGMMASDGGLYNFVEKFYSTSVTVNVDQKGMASWDTKWPYYDEWAVALIPVDDDLNDISSFSLVREQIYNADSQHKSSGYITMFDGTERQFFFEKIENDEGAYYWKDEYGKYVFDCHGAVNDIFGNHNAEYWVVVYSNGNTAAANYCYSREDQLYARSAMLSGWYIQTYYLDLSEEAQSADDVFLKLVIDDEIVYSHLSKTEGYIEDMDKWRFFFNIPMAKLNVPIHTYLCYNDKEVDMGEETAMRYIESILKMNEENGEYEEYMPVIRAMLNYAGYTQKYFGVNTDRLVSEGLYTNATDPVKSISAITIRDSIDAKIRGIYENEDMVLAGVSLVCKTNTSVKLYFKPKNGLTAEQLYNKYRYYNVNTSGDMETGYTSSNLFYLKINDQSAYYLSCIEEHVQLNSTDGHSIDMYYSPILYIKSAMSSSDEALVDLCKALYLFNRASVDYMTSVGYFD